MTQSLRLFTSYNFFRVQEARHKKAVEVEAIVETELEDDESMDEIVTADSGSQPPRREFTWNSTESVRIGSQVVTIDRQSWITNGDGSRFLYQIDALGLPM